LVIIFINFYFSSLCLFIGLYYKSIPDYDKLNDKPIDTKKYPLTNGSAIEFCTGIVDKNKSLEEIAVNLLREECGYAVDNSNLKKIVTTK